MLYDNYPLYHCSITFPEHEDIEKHEQDISDAWSMLDPYLDNIRSRIQSGNIKCPNSIFVRVKGPHFIAFAVSQKDDDVHLLYKYYLSFPWAKTHYLQVMG